MSFDIHGFDANLLDIPTLLVGIAEQVSQIAGWTLQVITTNQNRTLIKATPGDPAQYPSLAIKCYHHHDQSRATREYRILLALDDLGISVGPRAFYASETADELDAPVLICEWIEGALLQHPPTPDEEMWYRIMALLGTPTNLPFARYTSEISLMGTAPQTPGDILAMIESELAQLDENHSDYETLADLVRHIHEQVSPTWNTPAKVTLNHLDPLPHHFIWDGHHLRLVGWNKADWTDSAYAVGQLCAHPAYENVAPSHWVWYRWELARLLKDEQMIPRATTYTHLLQAFWAIQLTTTANDSRQHKQRDRYLQRAQRAFR